MVGRCKGEDWILDGLKGLMSFSWVDNPSSRKKCSPKMGMQNFCAKIELFTGRGHDDQCQYLQ